MRQQQAERFYPSVQNDDQRGSHRMSRLRGLLLLEPILEQGRVESRY